MKTLVKPQNTIYVFPTQTTVTPKLPLQALWLKDPHTGKLYCRWISQ